MKTFQERMDEVKVESYKDCVWYLEDVDKCKMCDHRNVNFSCHCKEDMDEFCTWISKFFRLPTCDSEESISEPYLSLDLDKDTKLDDEAKKVDEESDSLYKILMDALK